MTKWQISEAKARLSEVVAFCVQEPQVLYNRKRPVAALIDMDEYEAYKAFKQTQGKPTMAELLGELKIINEEEADIEAPVRRNRDVPALD